MAADGNRRALFVAAMATTVQDAARSVGIGERTAHRWVRQAELEDARRSTAPQPATTANDLAEAA
jgi:hypothetical protein